MNSLPIEIQIWDARQCAEYLGQSYSTFIKRTQYARGFPQRCPIPGQENSMDPSESYIGAARRAQDWIASQQVKLTV